MNFELQRDKDFLEKCKLRIANLPNNPVNTGVWTLPLSVAEIGKIQGCMDDLLREQNAFEKALEEITDMVESHINILLIIRVNILPQITKPIMRLYPVTEWKFSLGWQLYSFH